MSCLANEHNTKHVKTSVLNDTRKLNAISKWISKKDPKSRQRLLRFKWSRRQLPDFSRPWWHEGGVQGGHLRFESLARNISDDDDSNDDGDGDEDEDNLSCEEGVHEEEQLLQLGTDHLLRHLRTMFSVHFVWHIPGHVAKPSLLQDSHEFKRKT